MLHHHITKLDLEKLAEMKTADLEEYMKEIGARIAHLRSVTAKAQELDALLFMHPQDSAVATGVNKRVGGSGALAHASGQAAENHQASVREIACQPLRHA